MEAAKAEDLGWDGRHAAHRDALVEGMLDDLRILRAARIDDAERQNHRRGFNRHNPADEVRRRYDDPVRGASARGGIGDAGRGQRESSVHESVDAAAADQRRLRSQRHHVEFACADRNLLAQVLRHADGKSGVICALSQIGLSRIDGNEREIFPVYVFAEIMLVLDVDAQAGPQAELLRVDLQEAVDLAAVGPCLAGVAARLPLINLRDPNVGRDSNAAQLLLRAVGRVDWRGLRGKGRQSVFRARRTRRHCKKRGCGEDNASGAHDQFDRRNRSSDHDALPGCAQKKCFKSHTP